VATDETDSQIERSGQVPGRSNFIPTVQPFEPQADIDADLDRIARKAQFQRRERWENFRQLLTMSFFGGGFILIIISFVFAVYTLATLPHGNPEEFAKWIIEVIVGGLVAGLIGFWAVKSFEK
jgi:hypothetical protein